MCDGKPKTHQGPEHRELDSLIDRLKMDPELQGIVHLGQDGVVRSLDADRNVTDAVGLRPELIKAWQEQMPAEMNDEAAFADVDGTKVPREEWFNPPRHLLPSPLAEEHRERDPKKLAGFRKAYFERRSRLEAEVAETTGS
jgi:hypothetical protein